jgi:hypothetical protein
MRINQRAAVFVPPIAILLFLATALLFNAFVFGFASGEVMVNPSAKPGDNAALNRAATLSLEMFVAVQVALAGVAVSSGALRSRLHWAVRVCAAAFGGVILSYLGVVGIVSAGGLPRPLDAVVGGLGAWIRGLVRP